MVRPLRLVLAALLLRASLPAAGLSPTAQALSPTASPRPESVTAAALESGRTLEKNKPLEDFAVTSIISLPFAAFWAFVGATAVLSVSQGKFLPDYSDEAVIGAGATALGASLAIGVVSVSWGRGKAAPARPTATPLQP